MTAFDCAVLASYFQPAHAGHGAALAQARALAPRVVVLVLGAGQARSLRAPWDAATRRAQATALAAGDAAVTVASVRDVPYDAARWCAAITQAAAVSGRVALITDAPALGQWPAEWVQVAPAADLEPVAHALREALLWTPAEPDWAALEARAGTQSAAALRTWTATPEYAELRAEAAFLRDFRERWAVAPYPPVFVTVDALVTWRDEVLLIRRGRAPGRGQWALPGGFLDQQETLAEGARREAAEETGIVLHAQECGAVRVFDAPGRSLRGRTVTHVFHHVLDARADRPPVRGGDDAAQAEWFHRERIEPATLFEDHYAILQVMLGLA